MIEKPEKLKPPTDFDDNPEWTEDDFARALPAKDRLPPEVLAQFRQPPPANFDEAPELTDEQLDGAEVWGNGTLIQAGAPPLSEATRTIFRRRSKT